MSEELKPLTYQDEDIINYALSIVKNAADKSRENNFSSAELSYNDLMLIIKTISAAKVRTDLLNKLVQNLEFRKNLLCKKLDELKLDVLNDGVTK
jgi:hypothetical protein